MRRLAVVSVIAGMAMAQSARAEDLGVAAETDANAGPSKLEMGLFLGGFVSNFYHQFFDDSVPPTDTNRQQLDRVSPEFGVRFALFPARLFGLEAEGSYIMASTKMTGDSAAIFGLRAQAILQLPGRITPFVAAGIGLDHVSSDVLGSDTDFPIHAGVGLRFYATKTLALRVDGRLLRGPSSKADPTLDATYGEFSFGVSFVPGAAETAKLPPPNPDPDHDGVLGAEDQCPNEAGAVPDGCPVKDKDGDGIYDNVDKCPDQPETVNTFDDQDGCPDQVPDTDGDGFDDLVDKCKDQAEDKDGFQDDDGCPDPDNDGDGLLDGLDKCPGQVGPAENVGCPDTDGDSDGVVDRLDNCPTEAGTADNHGCKTKQLVVISKDKFELLDKVYFVTGSARLQAKSNKLLDNIARVMTAHPEIVKIKVEGHTDNVGKPEKNLKLSQDRASSVVAYLVKKGVDAARLEAVGHGQDSPVEDNATPKGREANRRVEFNIVAQ